jgi:putative sterol carrier protein
MAFYPDTDTLCGVMTDLFQRVMTTSSAVKVMQQNALVIRLDMRDPAFVLTVDGKTQPPRFICGTDGVHPDLILRVPADVIHRVWLGKTKLSDAFFSRQIQLEGSMLRAMSLSELFRQVEARYPEVLKEHGLDAS